MSDRNPYVDFAAHLSGVGTEKLDVERLRWQGIPVESETDALWEPIFIRSVERNVPAESFFDALLKRGFAFDPLIRRHAERLRLEGAPLELIIYRRIGAADGSGLFEILAVGGPVPEGAIAFGGEETERDLAGAPASAGVQAKRAKVVLGLIDDSIPLLNARFWDVSDASRIVDFTAQSWGAPPTILGHASIDAWLARLTDESETVLYRELAALFFPPLTRHSLGSRGSHGAHMLDLAGGTDPSAADPLLDVPVRVVQLPPVVYDDTSGGKMPIHVLDALQRLILQTAGTADALVVNVSLGVLAGPKDGSSFFEWLVARQIDLAAALSLRLVVVLPYGNEYAKQQVARRTLAKAARAEFLLRVQPDDLTVSYAELRATPLGRNTDTRTLKVGLRSPANDQLAPQLLAPGAHVVMTDAAGKPIARVYHAPAIAISPKPIPPYIVVALYPTKALSPMQPTSPSGAWTICVENDGDAEMDFTLQVQSDDSPYPRRTGARQSYLDAPSVHEFNPRTRDYDFHGPGDITHEGTNSAYSTVASNGAVSVGGAIVRREPLDATPWHVSPAGYTSEGADWSGRQPTASAVSGTAPVPRGVRAAGVHSHATVSLDGTSAAAATMTRDTVLRLMGLSPLPGLGPALATASRLGGRVVLDNPAIRKRGP